MRSFDFYVLNFQQQNNVVNGATPGDEVQVGNEYDFELTEMRGFIAGATDVTGPLLVELTLSGGQRVQENPMDMFSFSGVGGAISDTSQTPVKVAWSGAVIPHGTKVTAAWNNASGQTLDFSLMLIGRKVYKDD